MCKLSKIKEIDAIRFPRGTWMLEKLYLLSPRTWLGALLVMSKKGLNIPVLVQGFLSILLPMMTLWTIATLQNSSLVSNRSGSTRLIVSSAVSPWTFGCASHMLPEFKKVGQFCSEWISFRKPPLEDAISTLQARIENGRAYRTRRFDVYLPAEYKQVGLLFLPGFMVPHSAYSEVAAMISDSGIVVVVLSMEPLRIPAASLGADSRDLKRILRRVDTSLPSPAKWSIGGHSMGAYAAMRVTPQFKPINLVVWGAGTLKDWRTDLQSEANVRTLVVQGSCDSMCQFTAVTEKQFLSELPPNTVYRTIDGGNHCGFASYPPVPMHDGVAKISRKEQHRQVCSETANFLLRDN